MTESEKQTPSFKRKPRNTTYRVKVHFCKDTDKTFKDRVQRLIASDRTSGKCSNEVNYCRKNKKYPQHTYKINQISGIAVGCGKC